MNGWRVTWAAAQITGAVFSSLVWIVVWGLSLPTLLVTMAVGTVLVIGRNTRPMLWWRFGAAPANDFQRDTVLAAIVPIASFRGRRQPAVWIGRRLFGAGVVMPSSTLLIVSPTFLGRVASGQLTDRQASAIISQSLGAVEVVDSKMVNVLEAYCMPWRFVQVLIKTVSQFAAIQGTFRLSWKIRWIVFTVAIADNYLNARWSAFVGVIMISALSWSTGHFQKRWDRTCQVLRDQRTIAEGLGHDMRDNALVAVQTPAEIASIIGRLQGKRIALLQVLGINSLKSLDRPLDALVGDTVEGGVVDERVLTLRTSRHLIAFDLQRTGKVVWLKTSEPFRIGTASMPTVRLLTDDGAVDLTEPAKTKRITVVVNERSE